MSSVKVLVPPDEFRIETAPPLLAVPSTRIKPVPPVPLEVRIVTSVPPSRDALISVSPIIDDVGGSNTPPASVPAVP